MKLAFRLLHALKLCFRRPPFRGAAPLFRLWAAILPPLFLLCSCGLSERPYPLVRSYTLDLPADGYQSGSFEKKPKAVLLVTSSPPPAAYDGKKLVYKLKAHELSPDFYNEFYAPPARAVADGLALYLDQNSPALQIARYQGASGPDYSLEVGITDFYGDYSVDPPLLRLSVTVTLNDLKPAVPRVLFSSRYVRSPELKALPDEDRPENLVRQMSETLSAVYPEILKDLEKTLNVRR
ncbi:MAG: PqiC family protein [Deltaproteobacteria bacterium]|jgi:hypothetical protein|nr:PqiC family protein [Deltaproteobacteria bacterium]